MGSTVAATITHRAGAPSRQIPALDGIRGVAIFWVVLHNATAFPLAPSSRWLHVLPLFSSRGWIGVQLFFALSGFLITAGLLDSRQTAHYFRNFYAKRALRILPLYYTVLFVLLVVLPQFVALPYRHYHQAPLWLFTGNWTQAFPYGFGHFWSLAVEEQFYLIWPLIVWPLAPPRLLRACVWIGLGALVLRCILAAYGADWSILYTNTACRMDALALGGAGACVLRVPALRDAVRKRQSEMAAAALLVMWVALLEGRAPFGVGWLLNSPPLRSCGKYSYAMYVFHNLFHALVGEPWLTARFGKLLPLPVAFIYALAVFATSYVAAFCSWHLLEKHFLKLKRCFDSR